MVERSRVVFSGQGVTLDEVTGIACRLGRCLSPGDLVFLEGPLGAGKTTFVRALADALGVTDPVRSPSFTIANIYSGRITVQHLDLYRLEGLDDEDALALDEYVGPDAVTLVEWPEAGRDRLGGPNWIVLMDHERLDTRRLRIMAGGTEEVARWQEAGRFEG